MSNQILLIIFSVFSLFSLSLVFALENNTFGGGIEQSNSTGDAGSYNGQNISAPTEGELENISRATERYLKGVASAEDLALIKKYNVDIQLINTTSSKGLTKALMPDNKELTTNNYQKIQTGLILIGVIGILIIIWILLKRKSTSTF